MKISSLSTLLSEANSHNSNISKKVLITKGQIPHLTNFTQAVFPPGEVASEHSHQDMYEVFFVESGVANFKINGKIHQLKAGSCINVEPGDLHEVSNQSQQEVIITYFGVVI